MTDEELCKRLRGWGMKTPSAGADRIEELEAMNKNQEAMIRQADNRGDAWRFRADIAEAKLATCEKYRDAYDKMGRIGTEAYRDLEAKFQKAMTHVMDYSNDPHLVQFARATLAEIEGLGVKQTG
jgi:hypothetical protein